MDPTKRRRRNTGNPRRGYDARTDTVRAALEAVSHYSAKAGL